MTKRTIGVALLIVLILGGYMLVQRTLVKEQSDPIVEEGETEVVAGHGLPTFGWSYETTDAEIPQTTISLTASYPDNTTQIKEIDAIEGGCNAYVEPDADVYAQSEMIICYYAGLGHYYKVVESDGAYLVQRKVFEEASPEYDPPVEAFETIAQF